MRINPFQQSFDQLPNKIPIFPLTGAIVMPGGMIPLNIFEPRYLNMVRDAMQGDQLIGMIQPKDRQDSAKLGLYDVGCAARITQYVESNDGRLEIMLTGICRFKNKQEFATTRGYRLILPDWSDFKGDYQIDEDHSENSVKSLKSALKVYFQANNFETEWDLLDRLSTSELINNLIGSLPFKPEDKQMLLEAKNPNYRLDHLVALLQVTGNHNAAPSDPVH